MEILTTVATATCRHCGGAIRQMEGDLTGLGEWVHDPSEGALHGAFVRWCPGAPLAEPAGIEAA